MEIYKSLISPNNLPLSIALGYFDGIHKGHREVISHAVRLEAKGLTPAVFTFVRSPKSILFDTAEEMITDNETKARIIESLGVKILYMTNFEEVRNLTPKQFVRDILVERLNVKYAVCGFNYHFGCGGVADANELKRLCSDYAIKVEVVKPILYKRKPISSSRIRKALKEKDSASAKKMLFE